MFAALLENLRWFAGPQIRSVASVGGNIATATSISDLNPIWIAARAVIKLVSLSGGVCVHIQYLIHVCRSDASIRSTQPPPFPPLSPPFPGSRLLPLSEFFIDYRRTALQKDEVIESVSVPPLRPREFVEAYKQARRREDDVAIANSAMRVLLDESHKIVEISILYGGVNRKVIAATKTEQALLGMVWSPAVVDKALTTLPEDITLAFDAPGGMVEYRRTLTSTFFYKFYLTVLQRIGGAIDPRELSAIDRFQRPVSKATHVYEAPLLGRPTDTIGQPIPHLAADKQATGEAVYLDDIPRYHNELYGALVFSTEAHAEIVHVDMGAALHMPGVHGVYSAHNVPGDNMIGAVDHDEEVFATKFVHCVGQVIAIVLADTQVGR